MSRTYRNAWGPELRLRESRTEHKNDWRRNLDEELEEVPDPDSVYVIINEWTDIAGSTSSELTGGKFYTTEDDAWDALSRISEAHGVELDEDETSLVLEDHNSGLQSEEYRIEELNRG